MPPVSVGPATCVCVVTVLSSLIVFRCRCCCCCSYLLSHCRSCGATLLFRFSCCVCFRVLAPSYCCSLVSSPRSRLSTVQYTPQTYPGKRADADSRSRDFLFSRLNFCNAPRSCSWPCFVRWIVRARALPPCAGPPVMPRLPHPPHPHNLVQAVYARSVETRPAFPSRHCSRGARVYRHTTTAIHDKEYTRRPPPEW